jgi:hypothetical protein
MEYFLPPAYRVRLDPSYFTDTEHEGIWQPDVYPEAASLARRLRARKIIDIGCGVADKLVALNPEFEIIGIDYGPNIEVCRERYDFGRWIEVDLDQGESLGVSDFQDALLVCADVIEHLVYPERVVGLLSGALESGASALVLSTPDRELTNGPGDLGPPSNPSHVREWASDELEEFLLSIGLAGYLGRTRSSDVVPALRTILAVVPGCQEPQRTVVVEWFEERRRWQRVPEAMDSSFSRYESWVRELQAGNDWLNQRCDTLQTELERLGHRRLRRRIGKLVARLTDPS